MMTKKMLCKTIINKFVHNNKLLDEHNYYLSYNDKKLISHVFESTQLGIALIELGVLTKESNPTEYNYISNRAGILAQHYDRESGTLYFLTLRELLNMLPDEIDKKNVIEDIDKKSMYNKEGPPYY